MVVYNFKNIQPIPGSGDFVDIILTRTQRKTPTVVHPQYSIQRIRSFYMRKVKFTQQNISERVGQVIADFPRLNDIHPFYADLINILYDRDHYKLALGQLNTAKNLVETLSRDYVRLMKYGDSLYRCKQLKRAALGRMMTILKKQKAALSYLEEVRKHLARLPALDPNTRTLLITGYPNVGKSSFMNKITRANVDVQPYAFTTKSLYVGHMDYRYLRWQVVDTPGILDHPLEERNTIEMQAITALAHLQCCVLFFVDISEQCGWTIQQQLKLFESIRPLFANKQLLLIANKTDIIKLEDLKVEDKEALDAAAKLVGVELMAMSNVNEEGISNVKNKACDKLLTARVETRMVGKKVDDVMNRLTVAMPKPRDDTVREAFIPESVVQAKQQMEVDEGKPKRKTEKQLMLENGGAGVYTCDYRKYYDLKKEEWKWDVQPQIMNGKNVSDFIDPEIEEKLAQLEREEEQLEAEYAMREMDEESDIDEEERLLADAIKSRRKISQQQSQLKRTNKSTLPRRGRERNMSEVKAHLENLGVETEGISQRGRKRTRSLAPEKDDMDDANAFPDEGMDVDDDETPSKKSKRSASKSRGRSISQGVRSRSQSITPAKQGLKNEQQQQKAVKLMRKQRAKRNRDARVGESDRKQGSKLVKWQIAGKSGLGTKNKR